MQKEYIEDAKIQRQIKRIKIWETKIEQKCY